MKKAVAVFAAAGVTVFALAQNKVIMTREARNQEGRMFTMEEAVLGKGLASAGSWSSFEGNDKVLYFKDDGWFRLNLQTGLTEPAKTSAAKVRPALPEGAANYAEASDGCYAYTMGNGIRYVDASGRTHVVEKGSAEGDDRVFGQIVSRNEFGINSGIFFSPDGKKLAYYEKRQDRITRFPLLDIRSRTGELRPLTYPMAGMDSEEVFLHVWDTETEARTTLKVEDFTSERYLTNISWSPDSKHIYIQVLDRLQKNMNLNMYDAADGRFVKTVLSEHNDRWVEPENALEFVRSAGSKGFLKGLEGTFIYRTDNRDGYKNLYLCNNDGVIRRLTDVDADVEYVANDGRYVYYTSAEVSPVENHLFRTDLKNGKKTRLTSEQGWHSIRMNGDCSWFTDSYSNISTPGASYVKSTDGKKCITLEEYGDPYTEFATGRVELGTVPSADGRFENFYRLTLPVNFDPSKKYPLLVYVYGGPHSQLVQNAWHFNRWEMLMAQKGYVVYVQDNRGTANRGAEFEKAIHRQCGQNEMADQMVGIRRLMEQPWIDSGRIGVHGWSYGGFMTTSLITNYPEVFKVAVAGGPVIDWKWYEVMYGERYMETPQSNPEGYAKTSLINKAKNLKGKLLICQGAVDPTVVWQHSLSFVQECIRNMVQVDYFPYPVAEHNMRGRERVHLMDKVTMYFDDNL